MPSDVHAATAPPSRVAPACVRRGSWDFDRVVIAGTPGVRRRAGPPGEEMEAMIEEFPDGVISLDERRRRKKLGNELDKVDGSSDG